MNNYTPFYYDLLDGYLNDPSISIKDKYSSLDRMRNILTDLRNDIFVMKSGIETEEIDITCDIIINKINRRIIHITRTINNLLSEKSEEV